MSARETFLSDIKEIRRRAREHLIATGLASEAVKEEFAQQAKGCWSASSRGRRSTPTTCTISS